MDINKDFEAEKIEEIIRFTERFEDLTARKAMVSIAGISARNLYSWKEKGLIDDDENITGRKNWTRINIFDYVWLKMLVISRDIGISISDLRILKQIVEFDAIKYMLELENEEFDNLENEPLLKSLDDNLVEEYKNNILLLKKNLSDIKELYEDDNPEYKHLMNQLGNCIREIVVNNQFVNLYMIKDNLNNVFLLDTEAGALKYVNFKLLPHIVIPIYPIVMEFLGNPKNEKNLEPWGLINRNEKKIIDAIRKNDFKEITIKRNDGNSDLIIEATYEQNIMHEKAKEFRQLLCMKDYSEISVKYRNDKHLVIKQKKKL